MTTANLEQPVEESELLRDDDFKRRFLYADHIGKVIRLHIAEKRLDSGLREVGVNSVNDYLDALDRGDLVAMGFYRDLVAAIGKTCERFPEIKPLNLRGIDWFYRS